MLGWRDRTSASPRARSWAHGLALVVLLGFLAVPVRAHAAADAREIQARADFAAGRYQAALEIFARLYAETLHPIYLRNIGRCYQNLGDPDHSITSFRDYLRKAKHISADEHAEIEGYIKEMEDLRQARAAAPAATPVAPPEKPAPAAPPPAPPATAKVDLTVVAPPPAPARDASPPLYERWWFWAIVAGAVGAGVGVAAAAGAFTHTNDASCPAGFRCGQ